MTDSNQELLPPPIAKQATSRTLVFALILMVITLAIAFSYFLWRQHQQIETNHTRNTLGFKQLNSELSEANENLQRRLQALESENKLVHQVLAQSEEKIGYQARQLAQLSGGNRNDWLLSEAEYLLRLANQRLLLEHDIRGTELVLSAADGVLKEIDDPALIPARIALAEELLALQSLPAADIEGAYAKIRSMLRSIDQLPERFAASSHYSNSNEEENDERKNDSLWQQVLSELEKAVVIRNANEPVAPLLLPTERYYLIQNLNLIYEQVSLSLLSKNNLLYHDGLSKAKSWLEQYFDPENQTVRAHKEMIENLAQRKLVHDLPDISKSLKLVKSRIEALYRSHVMDKETPASEKSNEAEPK